MCMASDAHIFHFIVLWKTHLLQKDTQTNKSHMIPTLIFGKAIKALF